MASIKHIILGIAIALISVFFFAYAVQAVYPAPEYENFCDKDLYELGISSEVECDANNGLWSPGAEKQIELRSPETGEIDKVDSVITKDGYCDIHYYCRQDYDEAREVYERNVFFANLIIGIIVLVGSFFLALEAVSAGLMGGAVMLIFYATVRYWGNLSDIWRTVVLGLSLIILITLGYKKLRD